MSDADDLTRLNTNPDRSLPGEDPGSTYADDVRHWLAVYSELVEAKRSVLAELRTTHERIELDARPEIELDIRLAEMEEARLLRRLNFWRGRLSQMEGSETG